MPPPAPRRLSSAQAEGADQHGSLQIGVAGKVSNVGASLTTSDLSRSAGGPRADGPGTDDAGSLGSEPAFESESEFESGAVAPAGARGGRPMSSPARVLRGVRRLTALADRVTDSDSLFAGLATELLRGLECDEVHFHHLHDGDADAVVIHLLEGYGRLSFQVPREQRGGGLTQVVDGRCSLPVTGERDVSRAVPRLAGGPATEAALLVPLVVAGAVEAVVIMARHQGRTPFLDGDVALAETLIDQGATALSLVRARAEAGTDVVTGCMNRRAMLLRLEEEINRSSRSDGPLSALVIDLDNFKEVNDRHGHEAGDAVLREVALVLMSEFRAFDRVARYGGDEFVAILANADLASAAAAADRVLSRLAKASLSAANGIPASIGAAQWYPPMTAEGLLRAADTALLDAKRTGKGRIHTARGHTARGEG